jgi:hypothetical protein
MAMDGSHVVFRRSESPDVQAEPQERHGHGPITEPVSEVLGGAAAVDEAADRDG